MNHNYFIGKEERSKIAVDHTKLMSELYAEDIANSVANTKVYRCNTNQPFHKIKNKTQFILVQGDTVGTILQCPKDAKKLCVLNFASYKHPGGMFTKGSSAQEESLCHASFLYNVLSDPINKEYYEFNKKHLNKGLYTNAALYSPHILFEKAINIFHYMRYCDVLTCAAPNFGAASKYHGVSRIEGESILKQRLYFIKDILEMEGVDCFITGAWGCGVFKNDPRTVASLTYNIFKNSNIKLIILAVPKFNEYDNTYDIFKSIFG